MRIRKTYEDGYEILVSPREKLILKESVKAYLKCCPQAFDNETEALLGGLIAVDLDLKGDEH
jgi:hypothetical protein